MMLFHMGGNWPVFTICLMASKKNKRLEPARVFFIYSKNLKRGEKR